MSHSLGDSGNSGASAALRWLFTNTVDAVFCTANDGSTCLANQAMCTLDGRTAEDICERGGPEFADPADRSSWLAAVGEAGTDEGPAAGEYEAEPMLLRHDGSRFSATISSAWSLDDSGRLEVITIVRDTSRGRGTRHGGAGTAVTPAPPSVEADELQEFRRSAVEVNDDIVQALVAAETAFDLNRIDQARESLAAASGLARAALGKQVLTGELRPGSLLRSRPARRASGEPGIVATRVLIVDDSPDLRGLISAIFAGQPDSWNVIGEAGDGRQAIEIARRDQPDLVLLDLSMPVMDGLEALSEIRRVAPLATVVVVSGVPESAVRAMVIELGAHGFVQKAELVDTLIPQLTLVLAGRTGDQVAPSL